jgi:MYXO-CTERM domain-containing protein
MRALGTRALIAALLVAAAAPASAHDFWLYPKTHVPEKPGTVEIRIFLGMLHDVSEMERRPAHFKRFEAHGAAGVIDTQGRAGAKPGGFLDLPANDIYTLIYESRHGYIRLDAEKFTRYLADEGLPQILSERLRRGETDKPGDEGFARYVKALIKVGDADTGYDRRIGMQSELVALTNPFVGGRDGELMFQLWYLGKPAIGAQIDLFSIDDKDTDIKKIATAESDALGRVVFKTPPLGRYLVTGTTMRRAAPPVEADWESDWTSLTFEVQSQSGQSSAGGSSGLGRTLVFGGVLGLIALVGFARWRRRSR